MKGLTIMERFKRPLAILCLILMGILILGALVLAIIGTEGALRLLMADLFCLIVVPAFFYGYLLVIKIKKGTKEESEK